MLPPSPSDASDTTSHTRSASPGEEGALSPLRDVVISGGPRSQLERECRRAACREVRYLKKHAEKRDGRRWPRHTERVRPLGCVSFCRLPTRLLLRQSVFAYILRRYRLWL